MGMLLEPQTMPASLLDIFPRHGRNHNGQMAEGAIPAGQRNSTLASLAGSMRRPGMSVGAIEAALQTENSARCDPPLPEDEVQKIASSVGRYQPAESRFHRTDLGNAKRLVALHGHDLRYCFSRKTWLVWDGIRWNPDNSGEVSRRAKETVATIYLDAAAETNEDRRKELAKWAVNSESDSRINAMISLARSESGVPVAPQELDLDPLLFNVLNGTIDLRTGKLREHRREDLITMLAPVVFDPHVRDSTWDKFLQRILPDPALRGFVQRAAGYSVTGICSEEVLFFHMAPRRPANRRFSELWPIPLATTQ